MTRRCPQVGRSYVDTSNSCVFVFPSVAVANHFVTRCAKYPYLYATEKGAEVLFVTENREAFNTVVDKLKTNPLITIKAF